MKKILIPTILALVFLAQASFATAETVSFQLSVVLPTTIEMTAPSPESPNSFAMARIDPKATQMIQEQQMVRGEKEVLVRSIVAL